MTTSLRPLLSPRELKLIASIAFPDEKNLTLDKLAQKLKVNERMIRKMLDKQEVRDEIVAEIMKKVFIQLSPIIDASIAKAKDGSVNHTKLLLEMTGIIKNPQFNLMKADVNLQVADDATLKDLFAKYGITEPARRNYGTTADDTTAKLRSDRTSI